MEGKPITLSLLGNKTVEVNSSGAVGSAVGSAGQSLAVAIALSASKYQY